MSQKNPDQPAFITFKAHAELKAKLARAVEALKYIERKVPEKVDRSEAADMAVEFKIKARETLKEIEQN